MPVCPTAFGRRVSRDKVVLGFEVREIFANFVPGVILLCERQIGTGDVATVDGKIGKHSIPAP